MKKIKNSNKGFSLVELIVVIAIMAVMTAVLAPALLQYVEKSRAQKDDSAMGEVVEVVKLALADQDVYDECLCYTVDGNKAYYTVAGDEEQWQPAGTMRGLTITFHADKNANATQFGLAGGKVNEFVADGTESFNGTVATGATLGTMTSGASTGELYNKVKAGIEDGIVDLTSQTYRNSDYTIFISMGAADEAVVVTGQWSGTNIHATGSNVGDNGEEPGGGESGSQVEKKDDLSDYSWAEIQTLAQDDSTNLEEYGIHIGDKIYNNGMTYHLVSDERTEAYDGLVFMFKSGIGAKMNETGTNAGGYENSEINKTVIPGIYNSLENENKELYDVIKEVEIQYTNGNYNNVDPKTDSINVHMFLPSVREVSANYNTSDAALNTEGNTFDYFKDGTKLDGFYPSPWWLRSADGNYNHSFWSANNDDSLFFHSNHARNPFALIPAFVIG